MKKSAPSSKSQTNPKVEAALKAVYADGLNIYAMIGKLKKRYSSLESFPDRVLLGVCASYWRCKPTVRKRWPWFIAAMETETRLWICDQHEAEKPDPRAPAAQSIRDIMRNMFK